MKFTPTIVILTAAYFFVASITTLDIRLIQAKKQGLVPPDEPMLPPWVGIFGWLQWAIFVSLVFLNWKYAIVLFVLKFILKVLPVLEIAGNILMAPFRPKAR